MEPVAYLPVVGLAVLVVLAVDRLVARLGDRDPATRRPRAPRVGSGGPGFGDIVEIFQPTARFRHEEAERQRHDLVQPGDADPHWTVDLEHGTVLVPAEPGATGATGTAATTRAAGRQEPAGDRPPTTPRHRPRLAEVADGVWVATPRTWMTTSTVVVGPDGRCLVVDPALDVDEVTDLAAEIARRGWTPVVGFSTHPHWDHVLWTAGLGRGPRWATPIGARRAATEHEALRHECDAQSPGHDHALTGRLTPLPDGSAAVPWDGLRAVVVPYPAHCTGSAALVLPGAAVLIAGDMLSDLEIPLLDETSADPVGDYRTALEVLEAAATRYDVRQVVPGHGTVGDAAELRRRIAADRTYLDALTAGRAPEDPRLADPEQAAEHKRQVQRHRT
ncbi:MBL fold metallo-hydrolase [Cellulomonas sp. KRMCY2]|uniref:MBL fold metallo-hydrolase n=1 Tax=Cellulomonas sp. KRMCY2 TaxID=1304865 RepID=UPI0004B8818F|nr:MBL fold metallo-hydrolase [Cellulomonas sp. KRMCY2]